MPPQNFGSSQPAQQQARLAQQQAMLAQQQARQQATLAQQQAQQQTRLAQQLLRDRAARGERPAAPASSRSLGYRDPDGISVPAVEAAHPTLRTDPRLILATARAALERQDWSESADAFERLLSEPGYGAEARYGLGWIELHHGSKDRAQALLQEAVDTDPGHANAWFALGSVTEKRSVDDACDCYRKALGVNPDHYGAKDRLRLLGEPLTPPTPSRHPSVLPPSTGRPDGVAPLQAAPEVHLSDDVPLHAAAGLGIVEFLRRDGSNVARDALMRISALDLSRRFRVSAHLQRLATGFAAVMTPAALVAYILYHVTPITIGSTTIHFYSANVTELILAAVAAWGIWAAWTVLDCVTNTVTISNARIRWTHGVLSKHTETLDAWTARDVELDHDLGQRMTGDGTLTFRNLLTDPWVVSPAG